MPPIERSAVRPHPALLDRLDAIGSILCAMYCAGLPLVLAIAPAIGATFANPVFEVGFIRLRVFLALRACFWATASIGWFVRCCSWFRESRCYGLPC